MAGRLARPAILFFSAMNFCEVTTVFLAATSVAIERIRADRARVPERCHRPLEYLERRFCDPSLNVTVLLDVCAIKDRSFSTYFRDELGVGPARYIETRRIEVAECLVRETVISLEWIRGLLGYSSLKVFSNAFHRQTGYRPRAYRKRCRASATTLIESEPSSRLTQVLELKKALDGSLDLADLDRMIHKLLKHYPDVEANETPKLQGVIRSFYI